MHLDGLVDGSRRPGPGTMALDHVDPDAGPFLIAQERPPIGPCGLEAPSGLKLHSMSRRAAGDDLHVCRPACTRGFAEGLAGEAAVTSGVLAPFFSARPMCAHQWLDPAGGRSATAKFLEARTFRPAACWTPELGRCRMMFACGHGDVGLPNPVWRQPPAPRRVEGQPGFCDCCRLAAASGSPSFHHGEIMTCGAIPSAGM